MNQKSKSSSESHFAVRIARTASALRHKMVQTITRNPGIRFARSRHSHMGYRGWRSRHISRMEHTSGTAGFIRYCLATLSRRTLPLRANTPLLRHFRQRSTDVTSFTLTGLPVSKLAGSAWRRSSRSPPSEDISPNRTLPRSDSPSHPASSSIAIASRVCSLKTPVVEQPD
jgi:hypothetical protein